MEKRTYSLDQMLPLRAAPREEESPYRGSAHVVSVQPKYVIVQQNLAPHRDRSVVRTARAALEIELQSICPNQTLLHFALKKNVILQLQSGDMSAYLLARAIYFDFCQDPDAISNSIKRNDP